MKEKSKMQQRGDRMREIIFRGKTSDANKWIEGYLFVSQEGGHYIVDTNNDGDNGIPVRLILVNPETVGQYTGLTDENGKKIFEGDIVKIYDGLGRCEGIGKIQWNELFLAWHTGECKSMFGNYIASYEIIGNIYDNPELLDWEEE